VISLFFKWVNPGGVYEGSVFSVANGVSHSLSVFVVYLSVLSEWKI